MTQCFQIDKSMFFNSFNRIAYLFAIQDSTLAHFRTLAFGSWTMYNSKIDVTYATTTRCTKIDKLNYSMWLVALDLFFQVDMIHITEERVGMDKTGKQNPHFLQLMYVLTFIGADSKLSDPLKSARIFVSPYWICILNGKLEYIDRKMLETCPNVFNSKRIHYNANKWFHGEKSMKIKFISFNLIFVLC